MAATSIPNIPGSGVLSQVAGGTSVPNIPGSTILGQAAAGTTVTGASATQASSPFGLTTGWFVFFGVGSGILLSGTKAAPILLAVLSSALLYQIGQLIEGK